MVISALALLAVAAPAQAASKCELAAYATSELLVGPGGALLVPVKVAGKDAWMTLRQPAHRWCEFHWLEHVRGAGAGTSGAGVCRRPSHHRHVVETSLNTLGPRTRLSAQIARRFFGFEPDAMSNPPNTEATGRFVGQRPCEVLHERKSNGIGFNNCFGFVPFEPGTEVLRQLRIYIASAEQRIYITRNRADDARQ